MFCEGDLLDIKDLPNFSSNKAENNLDTKIGLQTLNEVEKIKEALRITRGSKSKAAELLKIDRKTLYNKLSRYGLE